MIAFAAAAGAQSGLPDTPAGRLFGMWLDAFNRGDRAAYKEFLDKHMPERAPHLDQEMGFREQTGGFELKRVEDSQPAKLTATVKERGSETFARAVLELDPKDPNRVASFNLRRVQRPEGVPGAPRLSEAEALKALRGEVEKRAAAGRFSGAVLVAKNGKPIFTSAYGMADREKKIPNKPNTRFRIGSMNKMFTATAVLQLAQAGKVKLEDPLGKYLTDYPNKNVASKVTIHHLLTHTGGTGDIFGPEFEKHRLELKTIRDYITLYGKRDLQFEPGSRWEYSNYGFLLLGAIIERVSRQSYYEYVREHIFKPAGMTATDSLPETEVVPDRSIGYMRRGQSWVPNTDTLPYRGTSAGGGYSSVEDLARFAAAVTGHKLLNDHYTALLTTGKVATPGMGKYAYGFGDTTVDGVRWIGHGGGAPGMNGDLRIYPQSGYVVAVLANLDPPAAGAVADFISERLPAK